MTITSYQAHVQRWQNCQACELWKSRRARRGKVVLARGQLPCDVLFTGEAPGASENVLGKPFCGPAGQLLDKIIAEALAELSWQPRLAWTNIIACLPLGDDGQKTAEPDKASIKACRPRLLEIIRLAQPRLIVLVGQLAEKHCPIPDDLCLKRGQGNSEPEWLPEGETLRYCKIVHPAAILRDDMSRRGLTIQRTVLTLTEALEELYPRYGSH